MKLFIRLYPILLAVIVFLLAVFLLKETIAILNLFPTNAKIVPMVFAGDVLVGLTIYLKTSVDFALFMGNLMGKNPGATNRIAIETGTALGNAIGTILVLIIWTFFKEVPILLIVAIILAALILLQLANENIKEYLFHQSSVSILKKSFSLLSTFLTLFQHITFPLSHFLIPRKDVSQQKSFFSLFLFSLTVPFLLGLDDFAGYIPLFTIVNVFGFSIGTFLGHTLLNIGLFAFPSTTIKVVRFPYVQLAGALAFILIACWGFIEAGHITITVLQRLR